MNSKMTTNSQLLTTTPKTKTKTKQTTRPGTESQKWKSHGGLSAGKDTGNKKHKWQVQNRQRDIKNSIGNEEAKGLICMPHGHKRGLLEGMGEKVQGISNINGRQKTDRGRVRIVQEMQKPKNLYVQCMDMN